MAGAPEDYSGLFFKRGHAAFYVKVMAAVDFLRADGAPAQAKLLETAFEGYWAELRSIATQIAGKVEETIVRVEHDSRVRPDTEGGGGPRLEDFIGKSDPLPGIPGSVGVNDEEFLRHSPVSWWWTNEEGYAGFVGEFLQGYFFDAPGGGTGYIPSSHMVGQHPVVRGRMLNDPAEATGNNVGEITNPIPARHFVEKAYAEVYRVWHDAMEAAKADFIAEMERILALPVP
jgi:hypothetical protein